MAEHIDRDRDQDLEKQGAEHSLEGKRDKVKGRLKDAAGGLTGDSSTQAEGKWDRLKGEAKDELGKAERELVRSDDERTP